MTNKLLFENLIPKATNHYIIVKKNMKYLKSLLTIVKCNFLFLRAINYYIIKNNENT